MIRINEYLINNNEVLYIEKYGLFTIAIYFKNGQRLEIKCHDAERCTQIFENITAFNIMCEG